MFDETYEKALKYVNELNEKIGFNKVVYEDYSFYCFVDEFKLIQLNDLVKKVFHIDEFLINEVGGLYYLRLDECEFEWV